MLRNAMKTKKGAASFYIVAFSTLILVIIAASFATAVINEIAKTSNDDLSQSAYDSALAGVEDAKLAYLNYQRCKQQYPGVTPSGLDAGSDVTCRDILYWMAHPDCYMVGHILGRIEKTVKYGEGESKEVLITDTVKKNGKDVTNNLKQAYTCVTITTELSDYRATLSSSNNSKVIKVDLADGFNASIIESVKIKWFSRSDKTEDYNFANIIKLDNNNNWRVGFQPVNAAKTSTPPTISVEMVQTADTFTLDDLTHVVLRAESGAANRTDRATIVMVPTGDEDKAKVDNTTAANTQWKGAYDGDIGENYFPSKWLVESNLAGTGRGGGNYPYVVYCPDDDAASEFACDATIDLPGPIVSQGEDKGRNNDTFMFVVSLPYGQPDTEFALEFYCAYGMSCNTQAMSAGGISNVAMLDGVQINIDSTGRANDLFRRVETRLEPANAGFAYPLYGIQLLGKSGNGALLDKNIRGVTVEHNSSSTYDAYLNILNSRFSN